MNNFLSFFTIAARCIFRASSEALFTEIAVHLLDFESIYQTIVLWLKDFTEYVCCLCLVVGRFLKLFHLVVKTRKRRVAERNIDVVFTPVNLGKDLYGFLIAIRS